MDVVLHRIEALPGEGRYAVTFRRPDGSEQTAVMAAGDGGVSAAEASLPAGWTRDGDPFRATADAVLAVHRARAVTPRSQLLRDVDGGWDVGLGNVVLGPGGTPACTADGDMTLEDGVWTCPACGARALLG